VWGPGAWPSTAKTVVVIEEEGLVFDTTFVSTSPHMQGGTPEGHSPHLQPSYMCSSR
jgi:hypothetical protein